MFVVAVGMGPFAGVMAIFVHNLGVLETLLRGGRNQSRELQDVVFGVVPQGCRCGARSRSTGSR